MGWGIGDITGGIRNTYTSITKPLGIGGALGDPVGSITGTLEDWGRKLGNLPKNNPMSGMPGMAALSLGLGNRANKPTQDSTKPALNESQDDSQLRAFAEAGKTVAANPLVGDGTIGQGATIAARAPLGRNMLIGN